MRGEYIFMLTTEVRWKSAAGKCYQFSDSSQLNYSAQKKQFSFDSKNNRTSDIPCFEKVEDASSRLQ